MLIYLIKKICSFLLILLLLSLIAVTVIYHSPNSIFENTSFWQAYYIFYQRLLFNQFIWLDYSLWDVLAQIIFPTFELAILAIFYAIIIGVPVGILVGLSNNNSTINYFIKFICLILYASPIIWIAILVMFSLSDDWIFIKVSNYQPTIESRSILDVLVTHNTDRLSTLYAEIKHLLLPTIILAIQPCIITIQQISQQVSVTNSQNYIKVARIRENSSVKILMRHLLPNALPKTVPQLTYNITTLLFSTMAVEILLNRSGLGTWIFSAYHQHDYLIIAFAIFSCGALISLLTLLSEVGVSLVYPLQSRTLYE
ncbi:ABC transporter permease subunit [Orbus sturtevantii]|uniref:ABC transporter permease subunit n=1 Tax=Orbus sturtevantii TaxID=3074109 RepID=UPI00370D64F4